MENALVQTVKPSDPVFNGVCQNIDGNFQKIRDRAYELFAEKGFLDGLDLENWLAAERELFMVPEAECTEKDSGYKVAIPVKDFTPEQITVTATGCTLTVQGILEALNERRELFRHFRFDAPIDAEAVTAGLEANALIIVLPKAGSNETARKEPEKLAVVARAA